MYAQILFVRLWFAYTLRAFSVTQWPWALAYGTVFTKLEPIDCGTGKQYAVFKVLLIYSYRGAGKVEMHDKQGLKPQTPNR